MNKLETKALLTLVSTLDQRKISDDVVAEWTRILADVSARSAGEAVENHFREHPDKYLQVGHVYQGARKLDDDARLRETALGVRMLPSAHDVDESGWRSDPQPVCREHDTLITHCYPCCDVLAEKEFWSVDERHRWAVANLYKAAV